MSSAPDERTLTRPPLGLRIGLSPGRGRGVFAERAFARGDVIEVAPVLVLAANDVARIDGTILEAYVFGWGDRLAVALGYGSLYNHAWTPNVEYVKRRELGLIEFVAVRDIAAGEELFTNYTASNPHRADLWSHLE